MQPLRSSHKNHKDAKAMTKVTLSLIVLAFVASSVTLWLLESPLKPMLYFFEAALILIIYHSLYGNFKKMRLETKGKSCHKALPNRSTTY